MFASVGLMVLALKLLQIDGEHIYSAEDAAYYRIIAGAGMFLLFCGSLLILAAATYFSMKLSSSCAALLGCLILIIAAVTWKIVMFSGVSVHSWTFFLLGPPLTCFLSSFLLIAVGAIRFLIYRLRPHPQ